MQYMLLGYLIKMETQEQDKMSAEEMEALLKMHLWIHDWERYDKLFGSQAETTGIISRDEKVEWTVPESRDELQALAELAGLEIAND